MNATPCEAYLPELMYIKWQALRQTEQKGAADDIGKQLVSKYGGNPLIAPVLLAQADDYLSERHYEECRELLTKLLNRFPQAEAAQKAQHLLEELDRIKQSPN